MFALLKTNGAPSRIECPAPTGEPPGASRRRTTDPCAFVIAFEAYFDARVGREVAEIGGIPQLERLDRSVVHVLLHRVRRAELRSAGSCRGTSRCLALVRRRRSRPRVGEMIPLRFGYCWRRPFGAPARRRSGQRCRGTICDILDFRILLLSSGLMKPIQAFWFACRGGRGDDRDLTRLTDLVRRSRSTSLALIPRGVAWLMYRSRQAGASESYVTEPVIPFCIAESSSVGQRARRGRRSRTRAGCSRLRRSRPGSPGSGEAGGRVAVPLVSVPRLLECLTRGGDRATRLGAVREW